MTRDDPPWGAVGPRRWPKGKHLPRAGSMSPSQSAIRQCGWSFHTVRRGIDPGAGGSPFSFQDCQGCRDLEAFLIEGWYSILTGCGETSTLERYSTIAGRWLHEPQPINNEPAGFGFPHPAWRYRPGVSSYSSSNCGSCACMQGRLIRGWEPVLPDMPVGLGLPHRSGRSRPRGSPFSTSCCRSCKGVEGFFFGR